MQSYQRKSYRFHRIPIFQVRPKGWDATLGCGERVVAILSRQLTLAPLCCIGSNFWRRIYPPASCQTQKGTDSRGRSSLGACRRWAAAVSVLYSYIRRSNCAATRTSTMMRRRGCGRGKWLGGVSGWKKMVAGTTRKQGAGATTMRGNFVSLCSHATTTNQIQMITALRQSATHSHAMPLALLLCIACNCSQYQTPATAAALLFRRCWMYIII